MLDTLTLLCATAIVNLACAEGPFAPLSEDFPIVNADGSDANGLWYPHPEIVSSFSLGNVNETFEIGEEITVTLHLSNKGEGEFNLTHIGGSLTSPYDALYYIQVLPMRTFRSDVLPPYGELSVNYTFLPDLDLLPIQYGYSLWVQYNESTVIHVDTFLNSTMTLEGPVYSLLDLVITAMITGLIVFLGYLLYTNEDAQEVGEKQGWLRKNEVYTQKKRSRVRRSNKRNFVSPR